MNTVANAENLQLMLCCNQCKKITCDLFNPVMRIKMILYHSLKCLNSCIPLSTD